METAVERNNQTRRSITFLRRLFYKIHIKTSQIMNGTIMLKQSVNIRDAFYFFWHSSKYECKVNLTLHLLCTGPIAFILRWKSENEIYFLNVHIRFARIEASAKHTQLLYGIPPVQRFNGPKRWELPNVWLILTQSLVREIQLSLIHGCWDSMLWPASHDASNML